MKILIVAATAAEIAPLIDKYELKDDDFQITPYFDVLITGVGMVATAYALGKTPLANYRLILNVGIAGSFDDSFKLGDVVQVVEDCFSELGAEDNDGFIAINEMGFGSSVYKSNAQIIADLPIVKGITVNTVHGNKKSIDWIINRLNPQVESMEGAAVFYAANQAQLAVTQIRSISNYIEPRNQNNWQIALAISKLNDWLIGFLKSMEN